MKPAPTASKAYSMIMKTEKKPLMSKGMVMPENMAYLSQHPSTVSTSVSVGTRNSETVNTNNKSSETAFAVKFQGKGNGFPRKKKPNEERWCTHCQKPGHELETCFAIHGYPDWFKEFKNKRDSVWKWSEEHS